MLKPVYTEKKNKPRRGFQKASVKYFLPAPHQVCTLARLQVLSSDLLASAATPFVLFSHLGL